MNDAKVQRWSGAFGVAGFAVFLAAPLSGRTGELQASRGDDLITKLMRIPGDARLVIGRDLRDDIALPDYHPSPP